MAIKTPIHAPLQDEHVLAVDPPLRPDQSGVWRRRINAFTGRALSDKALTAEQTMRSGLQRLHGLSMTAGVVEGLALLPALKAIGAQPDAARIQIGPGLGLALSGEDVRLGSGRECLLADLQLVLPVATADLLNTALAEARTGAGTGTGTATRTGTGSATPLAPLLRSGSDRLEPDRVLPLPAAGRMLRPLASPGAARMPANPFVLPRLSQAALADIQSRREGKPLAERLLPEAPRRIDLTLGRIFKLGAAAALPRAGVIVAQPIEATILGRQDADCPPDPRDDPYADLQLMDGARLLLFLWPDEMLARSGNGADYGLPPFGASRRNQLAYRIFDMERSFQGDEHHPWEDWGVPLALVGFNADWSLDFVDRAAVVRRGGAPRYRSGIAPQAGHPGLWQARIDQMVEHLVSLPDLADATLRSALDRVPPACVLPKSCYDPVNKKQHFFPGSFAVHAVPVPLSNLETVVREAASLVPYNMSVPDRVEMMIPVPDAMYEPGLLQKAEVDGRFGEAIKAFREDRGKWLLRRELYRRRYERLIESLTGSPLSWAGEAAAEQEINPTPLGAPPLNVMRTRRVAAGTALAIHRAETDASLRLGAGDMLWLWVRVHDGSQLKGLALRFTGVRFEGEAAERHPLDTRVLIWGDTTGLVPDTFLGSLPTDVRNRAPAPSPVAVKPSADGWIRLAAPVDAAWGFDGKGLAGAIITNVEFVQKGGTIEFGAFGKTASDGRELLWIGDELPGNGITRMGTSTTAPAPWPWEPVPGRMVEGVGDHGTFVKNDCRLVFAIEQFRSLWGSYPFLAADLARISEDGIDAFLTQIDARLKATNDAIDVGFVRARSDIYRVRQFMLGADSASRLVTSPALADLAIRDEGARVTSVGISDFIRNSMKNEVVVDVAKAAAGGLQSKSFAMVAADTGPAVVNNIVAAEADEGFRLVSMDRAPLRRFVRSDTVGIRDFVERADAPIRVETVDAVPAPAAAAADERPVPRTFGDIGPLVGSGQLDFIPVRTELAPMASSGLVATLALQTDFNFGFLDVQAQRPLPGLVDRTLSVAERLRPAPAVQALEYALATKTAVLQTLRQLRAGEAGRPDGVALGDLKVPGFGARKGGTEDDKDQFDPSKPGPTIDQLLDDAGKYVDTDDVRNKWEIERLEGQKANPPRTPPTRHESDYFTAAVEAIDNAIALMRLVEDRVGLFQKLADGVRSLRETLRTLGREAYSQIRMLDVEIEEARHDIATAEALLAEETQRVEELKLRRATILANHVPMVAYRRVRESNHRSTAPTQEALSGLAETPLAACARAHPDTPDEVETYLALMRQAPVKWFPQVAAAVARVEKAEAAIRALEEARERAAAEAQRQGAIAALHAQQQAQLAMMPPMLRGAMQAAMAQEKGLLSRRLQMLVIDPISLRAQSLAQAQAHLREHATLGDVIQGVHRSADLTRMASQLLAGMDGIAGCLHAGFAEVAPVIRLQWAEILSQFDKATPMHSLSGLPQWGVVPRSQRRDLQGLVDWCYQQIDRANPRAAALMDDLVRICMLLAAHAPVKRLIPARLISDAPARIGAILSLSVDSRIIRRGMMTMVRDRSNAIISRAIVEDISDGQARARIVELSQSITTISTDMRFELSSQALRMARQDRL